VSQRDEDGTLVAAAGYRSATAGRCSWNATSMLPVERLLATASQGAPHRSRVVEVGHLAAGRAGAGQRLILLLGPHLRPRGCNGSSAR